MRYITLLLLLIVIACSTPVEQQMQEPMMGDNMDEMMDEPMEEMGEMMEESEMEGMHSITSEEEFIVNMIPHHQEAVDTSKQVLETENEELKTLAENIITAQEQEIAMMQGWLAEWYPDHMQASYEEMMPDLLSLEGEARDRAYIEGMIAHHEGAVMMAEQVLKLNPRSEVEEFANNVIEAQTAEITQMRAMLNEE